MRVPDPTEQKYYNPTTALNMWERCVNNMGLCINRMGASTPYMELMQMMLQQQKLQFMMFREDISIKTPDDCFYYGNMLHSACQIAIYDVGCKTIVQHNLKFYDQLIAAVKECAKENSGALRVVDMLKNKLKPDAENDLEDKCQDAFLLRISERMLAPDVIEGQASVIVSNSSAHDDDEDLLNDENLDFVASSNIYD